MKYNVYYDSYDLNRKNVLVYGKEKIDLFNLNIILSSFLRFADHINIEEGIEPETLTKNDFIFDYFFEVLPVISDENLTTFVNETQKPFKVYREYRDTIANLQNITENINEYLENNNIKTLSELINFKDKIELFFEDYLNSLHDKFGFLFEKVEELSFEDKEEEEINKYIQNLIEQKEADAIAASSIEETCEENNSEEVVENETTEETIENEQPIE